MSNHLVVGINGLIGSALFNRLQDLPHIHCFGTSQRKDSLKKNVCYLNLLDTVSWPHDKFDVVYLCAGICRMALCEEDPALTGKVNVEGMMALVRQLAQTGAFIVYLSTNQVFSGNTPFAKCDTPYQPLNEYGRQKAEVERLIKTECPHSAIVRLTKVMEPNMQMIKNWISMLSQNKPIEAFHDMVLAPVTLRQVIDVLVSIGNHKQPDIYQVSGDLDLTYYDLAKFIAESLRKPLALVQSVSALEKGIKKNFLPQFTTLDTSSTIAACDLKPPSIFEVLQENFNLTRGC